MPPFYVGSTSIEKIESGYKGSVRSRRYSSVWQSELKNNPHLFKTIIISRQPTRKEAFDKEYNLQVKLNVVKNPLYINLSLACKNGRFGGAGKDNPMYGLPKELTPGYGRTGAKHPMYGKPGHWKNNKIPDWMKKKIKENHADVSGKNNPRAKTWKLTSPDGFIHLCVGELQSLARELNIGVQLLNKHLGNVVPPVSKYVHHPISKNTVGWKLEMVKDDVDSE